MGRYAMWENLIPREFPKPHEMVGDLKNSVTNLEEELFGEEIKEEKKKEKRKNSEDGDDMEGLNFFNFLFNILQMNLMKIFKPKIL